MNPTLHSYNPVVSLDPAVHYQTQSAKYDRLVVLGELTDSRIHYYEKQGRYGVARQLAALEREKRTEVKKKAKPRDHSHWDLLNELLK